LDPSIASFDLMCAGQFTNDVLIKVQQQRFFGISNGIDFEEFNPFTDVCLKNFGLAFDEKTNILSVKKRAKQWLLNHGKLPTTLSNNHADLLYLFIGRFEKIKGKKICCCCCCSTKFTS
jgi:glycogen synthase